MQSRARLPLLLLALGCLVPGTTGQAPAAPSPPQWDLPALRVAFTQLVETRPTRTTTGATQLIFSIAAEGLPASAWFRTLKITKAEDNLGRTIPPISVLSGATALPASGRTGSAGGPIEVSGWTGPVARDAKSLAFVEGVIEFDWQPYPGGQVVRIDNVAGRSGPSEAPELTKLGIVVTTFSDPAGYERLRSELGLPPGPAPDSPSAIGFHIRDLGLRLLDWQLQEESGRTLPSALVGRSSAEMGSLVYLDFSGARPTGARLVLRVRADTIVKAVPFRVEDIKLP